MAPLAMGNHADDAPQALRTCITFHLGGDAAQLIALRHKTRIFFRRHHLGDVCAADLVPALHETVVNALRHGSGAADVEAALDGHRVTPTVTDEGATLEPASLAAPCPGLGEHGRGLYLVMRLVDDVSVLTGRRACLRMVRAV